MRRRRAYLPLLGARILRSAPSRFEHPNRQALVNRKSKIVNGFKLPASIVLLLATLAWPCHAEWMQQTIVLRAGWNAVFLNIQPEPADCDGALAGLPVESVWDFNPSIDAPQFVQDPNTLIPGSPSWLTWFPPVSAQAGISSLFALRDGRPYLIKLPDNAAPANWVVTGRPSLRPLTWHPGGVNFVGFRVGATGPTFQTLFAGESGLANQPVYTLGTAGDWQQVLSLSTTRPESGKSYWVRCASPAQRSGTIVVQGVGNGGLTFRSGATEQSLRIRNTSAAARNISVRLLASATPPPGQPLKAGPVPLEYRTTDYSNAAFGWATFPAALTFNALPAGQEWNVRLGARLPTNATAPGSSYQSLLEISDDAGTRWILPVSAIPATSPTGEIAAASAQPGSVHSGLWIGDAVINAVSQPANPGNPTLPRRTGGQFSFRLIVHVDAAGVSRLLQNVYLVRKPATLAPDPGNPELNIVAEPARIVVATDEALIPTLVGNGEITGRRISTAAFAFRNPTALSGETFGAGSLMASVTLDYNHALNPFKHRYHPDHDNLDERFEQTLPEGRESFTIQRTVTLQFTGTDPNGANPPGWGDSETGGLYRETITGVHRNPIYVAGTFRLVRVTKVSSLNDAQALDLANAAGR